MTQPADTTTGQPARVWLWTQIVLIVVAVIAAALAVIAFVEVRWIASQHRVFLGPTVRPAEVDTLTEIAAQAGEQINQYLTLLQTGTAILGVAGVVLTGFGVVNLGRLNVLRDTVNQQLDDIRIRQSSLKEAEQNLKRSQEVVQQQITRLETLSTTIEITQQKQFATLQQSIQAVSQLQFAVEQADLGNFSTAQVILQDIHRQTPDDPVVNYYLGDILTRQGDFKKGSEYLEIAQRQPNFWAAKASYAYAKRVGADAMRVEAQRESTYDDIDRIFRTIYEHAPLLLDVQRESAFGAWGSLHKRRNNIKTAIEIYEHCARVTPQSSYPLINLGQLHLQFAGQTFDGLTLSRERGVDYYEQAKERSIRRIQLNPTDHWPVFDAIAAMAVVGDPMAAIQPYLQQIDDLNVIDEDIAKLCSSLANLAQVPGVSERVREVLELLGCSG